jgi:hypothetical protein
MLIAILYPHGGLQLAQNPEEVIAIRAEMDTMLNFFFLTTILEED